MIDRSAEIPKPMFSAFYRGWLLAVLLMVQSLGFVDRFVLATLLQSIKLDLKVSDFQIGLMQGVGFYVLYAVLGLPIARLAEHRSRVVIISIALVVRSIMIAGGSLARNFMELFPFRVGVG